MMINCSDKHKTKKLEVCLLKIFFHVVVFAKFPNGGCKMHILKIIPTWHFF